MLCKREPSPERPAHSRAPQASAWQPQCAAPRLLRWTSRLLPSTPRRTLTRCTGAMFRLRRGSSLPHLTPCRPSRKDQGGRGLSGGAGQVACRRIPVGGGDCADRKGLQRAEIRMREQSRDQTLGCRLAQENNVDAIHPGARQNQAPARVDSFRFTAVFSFQATAS